MINLTDIKLPDRFNAFVAEKMLDLEQIQEKPSKVLNFFLKCKALHTQGDAAEATFLSTVKEALVLNKNLKSYQFLKLVCNCPELIGTENVRFIGALRDFEGQLSQGSKDMLFYRAKKIALLLRANPTLPSPTSLDMPLTSSDGQIVMVDRFSWAAAIAVWRPMLTGAMQENKQVGISEKLLRAIDHFIKENTLPELSMDELLQLFTMAEGLRFLPLRKKCAKVLGKDLNGDNVLKILRRGLDCKSPHLIDFCLQFLDENEESLSLSWYSVQGLKVVLKDIAENTLAILETIAPDIYRVTLEGQAVVDQVRARDLQFSHANALSLHGDIDPMTINALAPHFPNVKSFSLSSVFYQKLKAEHVAKWTNVETLHVRGEGEFNLMPLFPVLKLYIRESKGKLELKEENGILICYLGSKPCSRLNLSPYSRFITDQMLIDFIQHLPECNKLDLTGCIWLTHKSGQTIVSHLVRRVLHILNDQTLESGIVIKSSGLDPSILVSIRRFLELALPACDINALDKSWNFYLNFCLI